MSTPTYLREQGEQQATAAADFRIVALIDAIIEAHAKSGHEFSANTIRDSLPATSSRGLVGARVDAARKRGELVAVGFTRSTLPSTRGAWIKRWIGAR